MSPPPSIGTICVPDSKDPLEQHTQSIPLQK